MATKKEYTCVLVETDNEGITWITFTAGPGIFAPFALAAG